MRRSGARPRPPSNSFRNDETSGPSTVKGRNLSHGQEQDSGRCFCLYGNRTDILGCLRAGCSRNCASHAAAGCSAQPDAHSRLEHHVADRRHQSVGDPRLHTSGRQCLDVGAADVLRIFADKYVPWLADSMEYTSKDFTSLEIKLNQRREVERRQAGHLEGCRLHFRRTDEEREAALPCLVRCSSSIRSKPPTT